MGFRKIAVSSGIYVNELFFLVCFCVKDSVTVIYLARSQLTLCATVHYHVQPCQAAKYCPASFYRLHILFLPNLEQRSPVTDTLVL